jgi:putative transposon-encoded protein
MAIKIKGGDCREKSRIETLFLKKLKKIGDSKWQNRNVLTQ